MISSLIIRLCVCTWRVCVRVGVCMWSVWGEVCICGVCEGRYACWGCVRNGSMTIYFTWSARSSEVVQWVHIRSKHHFKVMSTTLVPCHVMSCTTCPNPFSCLCWRHRRWHTTLRTTTTMKLWCQAKTRCNSASCDMKMKMHQDQTKSFLRPSFRPHNATHPLLCGANEANGDYLRTPSLKLGHPVGQGGLGCNDNVWPRNVPHEAHVA